MSYIISAVVDQPVKPAEQVLAGVETRRLVLRPAPPGSAGQYNACYLDALRTRINLTSESAYGLYLLTDAGEGYLTSSPFVCIPQDDKKPIFVSFPQEVRQEVENVFLVLLNASTAHQIYVICEPTFSYEGSDPEKRYEYYAVNGPMLLRYFWSLHDRGGFLAEAICIVSLL